MNNLHTIKLISDDDIETLKRVMCFAYSRFRDEMEVEFSDGYVKTYDMKHVIKMEIE